MEGENGTGTEASGFVNTLQSHVDDIRGLLHCGICIRPLYEPFTLACGHTFCYSCLSSWFAGGRSKRTCPDCRAPVKTLPAPAYLVRAVVQMFTSRAELLDEGETTAEHSSNQKEESERLDRDKANTDPRHGGLFGGLFNPKPPQLHPIVDVDDNVTRCPQCNWELAGDEVCESCGYIYQAESDGSDYTDESDDFSGTEDYDGEVENDEFGDFDTGDFEVHPRMTGTVYTFNPGLDPTRPYHLPPRPPFFQPPTGGVANLNNLLNPDSNDYDDDYEEEEPDEYEADSFIDDEERPSHTEEWSQPFGSNDVRQNLPPYRPSSSVPSSPVYQDISFHDEYEDEDEVVSRPRRLLRGTYSSDEEENEEDTSSVTEQPHPNPRRGALTSDEGDHEEDSEVAEDEDSLVAEVHATDANANRGRRRNHRVIFDDDDEDSEPSSSSPPPQRRPVGPSRTGGASASNVITIDDSDEDQPVGPVRRRTVQRPHFRFSPY
ncbi:hypothetical protein N7532_000356 [Penicillium argentinense]|uniref:RING-type domain-containing protein n=1 Tax=Penicillium argentinense TaxID=1131581 RepID=A0A9W9G5C6_9EURO|nr:uncharacterized protein N7532_000356 [Penicillium argentinense]KAJ5112311.1 hypothetical protein N7532_000356 [Penicillium argentinense]